ncbi:META domain-containing protein [Kribbella swartbergensis]
MRTQLLGLLVLGLTLTACGSEVQAGGGSPVGKSYLSVSVTEDGKARRLAPNTRIRLDFREDGVLAFHTGCNQLSGLVSLDGDTVVMDTYGGTEMACEPARQAQDEWVGELLTSRPTWTAEADTLTITRGSTTLVLQEESSRGPSTTPSSR